MPIRIERAPFGVLPDGRGVEVFKLSASQGVTVCILSLGGVIQSVRTPDRKGRLADIVLGFDDVDGYLASASYLGAIIGRVAGRLAGGRLRVDGQVFELSRNDGENTLHGGAEGFDRALWRVVGAGVEDGVAVLRLAHDSPDGDQGFPGALAVSATYALQPSGVLSLDLEATSSAPTRVNLTSHPYWNLSGTTAHVGDHVLQLAAHQAFVMGGDLVPARSPSDLTGSALDLRAPRRLADVIAADDEAVRSVGGLDHLFVLSGKAPAARVVHPFTGRTLTIETDASAIVAYGGDGLANGPLGKGGAIHAAGSGLALEPQDRPDRPATLRPGEIWRQRHVLTFGVDG